MKKKLISSIVGLMLTMVLSTPSYAANIPSATNDRSAAYSTLAASVSVTGVSIRSSLTLIKGNSAFLYAKISPLSATNRKVTWQSSDPLVATVDQGGKVVGLKAGTAEITVTTLDGNKTATCKVTVTPPPVAVTGVSLDSESLTVEAYTSVTLAATVAPENATNQNITWTSSKPSVAKVDKDGEVVCKKAGTATITATTNDGHKKATCRIKVVLPEGSVTGIKLNKTSLTLYEGGSKTLEATVYPFDADNQDVIWKSTEPSVADVDCYGRVTAIERGLAEIMAITVDGNKMAYCKITVKSS